MSELSVNAQLRFFEFASGVERATVCTITQMFRLGSDEKHGAGDSSFVPGLEDGQQSTFLNIGWSGGKSWNIEEPLAENRIKLQVVRLAGESQTSL